MTRHDTSRQEMRENMNHFRFQSNGASLSAVVYLPSIERESPGVLLYHGLSNSRHLDPMLQVTAEQLQKQGFATMQFDFFGSGESDGLFHDKLCSIMEANAADALRVFRQIPYVDAERVGLWGRSVGAPMAALLADQVAATVLVSPGYKMSATFAPWMGPIDSEGYVQMSPEYPHRLIKGYWKLKEAFFQELPALEERMKDVAQRSRNVCVIQGDADLTIRDWSDSEELLCHYQEPRRFVRIAGADHRYQGKKEQAVAAAVEWFAPLQQH